ncbi:MAG: hypothetical protein DMG58_13620 [Acidobacteria bacterium]|nr:MAG: hypothetical protein DMG58_13620 [Acidobacteriota bacterium]
MKNALWFALLSASLICAQEKPAAKPDASTQRPKQEKPTPRAKARELLDNAAEMVAATNPQVHAAGLMHLAYAYETLNRKKAIEFYQQAFTSSAVLGANARENLQPDIVTAVAQLSLPDAIEMVQQIRPAPAHVVGTIVAQMMQKEQIAQAIELVETTGSTGAYSFGAVEQIFKKLPEDDPRRIALFSSAMSAYTLHSQDEGGNFQRGFADLLARHWQEIPRSMADLSLTAIINNILDRKDDDPLTQTVATEKGAFKFNSRKDVELFEIINVVQGLDPKRAQELLEKRPDLRAAFELFPGGSTSINNSSTSSTSDNVSFARLQEMRQRAQAESLAAQAMAESEKDPRKALEIAGAIEIPALKARALGAIAGSVGKKDPEFAKGVLSRCSSMLSDIKDPGDRMDTWATVAQTAWNIKDEKQAWEAIDHGIADATALYKLDTDEDSPNVALREYWPSTQAYRRIISCATKLFGVDAEPMLMKIRDPDLALLAQIEMGSTLLAKPGRHSSTMNNREGKKKS